jgi:hypothetical protein
MKRTLVVSFYGSLARVFARSNAGALRRVRSLSDPAASILRSRAGADPAASTRARTYIARFYRAPGRLAKASLACSLLALVATSAPPEWHVEDEAREPFTFVPGQPNKLVTAATVIYRTPRGTWPLSVTHDVHLGTLADDRSRANATRDPVSADSVVFEQDSHLDARTRLSTKTSSQNAFEVVCSEAHCEGSLEIDLGITYRSREPPPPLAATGLSDGGSAPDDPPMVTLRASFFGGSDKPMFGCDAKDSSNDLEEAPKQLGVDVTMLPFQAVDNVGVVPGAQTDASVALPPPVGLDASLVAPAVPGPDAGL